MEIGDDYPCHLRTLGENRRKQLVSSLRGFQHAIGEGILSFSEEGVEVIAVPCHPVHVGWERNIRW